MRILVLECVAGKNGYSWIFVKPVVNFGMHAINEFAPSIIPNDSCVQTQMTKAV